MVFVGAGTHSKHVQVIRSDIEPGSVERSRDAEKGNDIYRDNAR
jgi:hypothetical protein